MRGGWTCLFMVCVLVGCDGGGANLCNPDDPDDPDCIPDCDQTPDDPRCAPASTDVLELIVSVTPEGAGTVTVAGPDDYGNSDTTSPLRYACDPAMPEGVMLTASPNEGYTFVGWSGDCEPTDTPETVATLPGDGDETCDHDATYSYQCDAMFEPVSLSDAYGDATFNCLAGLSGNKIAAGAATPDGHFEVGALGTELANAVLDMQAMPISQSTETRGSAGELRVGNFLITSTGLHFYGGQATVSSALHSAFWMIDGTGTVMNANLDASNSPSLIGIADNGAEIVAGGGNELYLLSRTTGALSSAIVMHGTNNDPVIRKIVAGPSGSTVLIGSFNNLFWVSVLDSSHAVVFSKTYAGTVATGLWNGASVVGTNVIVGAASKGFTNPDQAIVLASISLTDGAVNWTTALAHTGMTAYFGSLACTSTSCFVGGALGTQALIATCDPSTGACASFLGFDSATSNTVVSGMTVVGDHLCGWEDFGNHLFCMPMASLGLGTCSSPSVTTLTTPFTATSATPTVADVTLTLSTATTNLMPLSLSQAATNGISISNDCHLP